MSNRPSIEVEIPSRETSESLRESFEQIEAKSTDGLGVVAEQVGWIAKGLNNVQGALKRLYEMCAAVDQRQVHVTSDVEKIRRDLNRHVRELGDFKAEIIQAVREEIRDAFTVEVDDG